MLTVYLTLFLSGYVEVVGCYLMPASLCCEDGHSRPSASSASLHARLFRDARKLQSQLFFDQLNAFNETNMGSRSLFSLIPSPVGRISQGYIITILHQAVSVEVRLGNKWLAGMDLRELR